MFLSEDELTQLTGKKLNPARIAQLNFMGIQHKVRADGKIVVLKTHIENLLDNKHRTISNNKETKPNWEAI